MKTAFLLLGSLLLGGYVVSRKATEPQNDGPVYDLDNPPPWVSYASQNPFVWAVPPPLGVDQYVLEFGEELTIEIFNNPVIANWMDWYNTHGTAAGNPDNPFNNDEWIWGSYNP